MPRQQCFLQDMIENVVREVEKEEHRTFDATRRQALADMARIAMQAPSYADILRDQKVSRSAATCFIDRASAIQAGHSVGRRLRSVR